jgi:hypothetical protein
VPGIYKNSCKQLQQWSSISIVSISNEYWTVKPAVTNDVNQTCARCTTVWTTTSPIIQRCRRNILRYVELNRGSRLDLSDALQCDDLQNRHISTVLLSLAHSTMALQHLNFYSDFRRKMLNFTKSRNDINRRQWCIHTHIYIHIWMYYYLHELTIQGDLNSKKCNMRCSSNKLMNWACTHT